MSDEPTPGLSRADIRRRLRAARAFADFTTPEALAQHPELQRYGIRASRIVQTEAMNRDAELWELEAIARATGLPLVFFTVKADALADALAPNDVRDQLHSIAAKLDAVLERDGKVCSA